MCNIECDNFIVKFIMFQQSWEILFIQEIIYVNSKI